MSTSRPLSLRDPGARLALCVAGLVAITLVRVAWLGTLLVDGTGHPWSWGLLGLAWLVLGVGALRAFLAALDRGTEPLRRLLAPALVLHVVAALALPYTSNDLFSNLAYGRMLRLGLDPYALGPSALPAGDAFRALVSSNWRDTPSVYGPVLTALHAVAGLAGAVPWAMAIFKVIVLAVTLATVLLAYAVCRKHVPAPLAPSAFVLFAWNPLLAHEISGQAHNDAVMLLGLTAFVWAALEERELLAVLLLALAFYAKFAVAPVLGLYLWYLARRSPGRALIAGAMVAALGVALFLPFWSGPSTLAGPAAAISADRPRVTRSFAEILYLPVSILDPPRSFWVYRACWGVGTAGLAVLALRALRRVRTVASVLHESLVFLLFYLLVAAPFVLPWYLTWLLPLTLTERDPRWRRVVALYTGLSLVAWCADVPVLQVAVVNTAVLMLARRWFFGPGQAAGEASEEELLWRKSA